MPTSFATDVLRCAQVLQTPDMVLPQGVPIEQLGTAKEETSMDCESLSSDVGRVARPVSSDTPNLEPPVTSLDISANLSTDTAIAGLSDNSEDEIQHQEWPLSPNRVMSLVREFQSLAGLLPELQKQLQDSQKCHAQLAAELHMCNERVASIEGRVDCSAQHLLSSDHDSSTLRDIDNRLSAVCLHLEDSAPVLARSLPSELPRIDATGEDACELPGVASQTFAKLQDSVHRLEDKLSKQHQDLKEQIETLAKAGDDDVAELSANVAVISGSMKRVGAEHQELKAAFHDMLNDLELKMRDERRTLLSEDDVKNLIARDRHDRGADMEAALMGAIAGIFRKLTSRERGSLVTDDDKEAAMKAARASLRQPMPLAGSFSVSTKAPTTVDEDEDFYAFLRTAPVTPVAPVAPVAAAAAVVYPESHRAPAMMSPPMQNYRHTLTPGVMRAPLVGLPQSPMRSSRRTLSPSALRRGVSVVQATAVHSARRLCGPPSSPILHPRVSSPRQSLRAAP